MDVEHYLTLGTFCPSLSTSPCVSCIGRLSIVGGWPVSLSGGISLKGGLSPLSNQGVPPVTSTWFCSVVRLSGFPTNGLASARSLIRAVGYLVGVYQFPNNTFESIPPGVLHYIVRIGDTLLVIIPPEAIASKYTSVWYTDSDSVSASSGDSSLHL